MPRFTYEARDKEGKKQIGSLEAAHEEELLTRLQGMDLWVTSVALTDAPPAERQELAQQPEQAKGRHLARSHYGINSNDLVVFCRQLTTLLGAGVTILKSLDTISQQVASQRLYKVIQKLKKDMEGGASFHEALSKQSDVFSDLWINLVESGEASGNLAVVLDRLAMYLERDAEFRRKLISALVYPAILVFASVGALLFMTVKIIPTFAEVLKGFNVIMPKPTQILIGTSAFIRQYILLIVGALTFGIYLMRNYIRTKEGKRKFEQFLFKVPAFGDFFRAIIVERFTSEMSTLVESGVPILYSLEIAENSVGSLILGDIIKEIKDDVRGGKPLHQPLERSNFFEPMVVQMVSIGEEIGELSQMFKRINQFYQGYVEAFLARFLSMFEPVLLIFMGGIIGMMVVSMFLPIFQLSKIGATGGGG